MVEPKRAQEIIEKADRESRQEMLRERTRLLYIQPRPMIPFPTKDRKITPAGFVRPKPSLAQRLIAYLD